MYCSKCPELMAINVYTFLITLHIIWFISTYLGFIILVNIFDTTDHQDT